MDLQQLKGHYTAFDGWLQSLKEISDSEWHMPVGEGKWSVAAVVSHLLFWDMYSLEERFPYFEEGAVLPSFPNFQSVNDQAEEYSKKATKVQIIDEFLAVRQKFQNMLEQMDNDKLAISFKISDHDMTVGGYITGFVSHDLHHKKQVVETLNRTVEK